MSTVCRKLLTFTSEPFDPYDYNGQFVHPYVETTLCHQIIFYSVIGALMILICTLWYNIFITICELDDAYDNIKIFNHTLNTFYGCMGFAVIITMIRYVPNIYIMFHRTRWLTKWVDYLNYDFENNTLFFYCFLSKPPKFGLIRWTIALIWCYTIQIFLFHCVWFLAFKLNSVFLYSYGFTIFFFDLIFLFSRCCECKCCTLKCCGCRYTCQWKNKKNYEMATYKTIKYPSGKTEILIPKWYDYNLQMCFAKCMLKAQGTWASAACSSTQIEIWRGRW